MHLLLNALGVLCAERQRKPREEPLSMSVRKIIPGQQDGSAANGTCHTSLETQVSLQNHIRVEGKEPALKVVL